MVFRASSFSILVNLWIAGILMGGCSLGKSQQQDFFKEYRKKMEMQKAALAKEEEKQAKLSELGVEGYETLGDQYLRQGNMDLAFLQYYKALRIDPTQIHIQYKLGRLFLEKGMPEEAEREFQEILKRTPDDALAHEGMGRVHFKQANFPEAERSFQRAVNLKDSLWQAHNFLGIIYDRQGKFHLAISHYRSAIALKPNSSMLYNNLGTSLFLKGDYERAVSAFTEALTLENSNKKIHNNLALALSKLERHEEAFKAFKEGGDEASANYSMGCVYMLRGKFKEAIENFEKAIQMKSVFYAKAYENLKKAREAVKRADVNTELSLASPSPQTKREEGISKSENYQPLEDSVEISLRGSETTETISKGIENKEITTPHPLVAHNDEGSMAKPINEEEQIYSEFLPPVSPSVASLPHSFEEQKLREIVTVRDGQTMYSLVRDYYHTVNRTMLDSILDLNPEINNIDHITPNQKIRIPDITEELLIIESPDGTYKIHAATFGTPGRARNYVNELALRGKEIEIIPRKVSPKDTWYRVVIGTFNNKDEVLKAINLFKERRLLPIFLGGDLKID